MGDLHSVEYYLTLERKETQNKQAFFKKKVRKSVTPRNAMRMNLDDIILREINQSQTTSAVCAHGCQVI